MRDTPCVERAVGREVGEVFCAASRSRATVFASTTTPAHLLQGRLPSTSRSTAGERNSLRRAARRCCHRQHDPSDARGQASGVSGNLECRGISPGVCPPTWTTCDSCWDSGEPASAATSTPADEPRRPGRAIAPPPRIRTSRGARDEPHIPAPPADEPRRPRRVARFPPRLQLATSPPRLLTSHGARDERPHSRRAYS